VERVAQQYVAAVATVLVGLAALVSPAAFTGSDLVVLSLATLALGCALRFAWRYAAVVPTRTAPVTRRRADAVPVLTDRVTDPVHHPLAPRAPGPA
jgi:hypothetical protein